MRERERENINSKLHLCSRSRAFIKSKTFQIYTGFIYFWDKQTSILNVQQGTHAKAMPRADHSNGPMRSIQILSKGTGKRGRGLNGAFGRPGDSLTDNHNKPRTFS